jgi:phosphoesterase RecJ-like protein
MIFLIRSLKAVALTMNPELCEAVGRLIRGAKRILIVTHVAPDGDAIGSLLGLGLLLRAQGLELTLACEDSVPKTYDWLPASDTIVKTTHRSYDLVISLDCSDARRMGQVYGDDVAAVPLVNIDHHVTNTGFGTVNWVDPTCVATTQMILYLADALNWELTAPVATCLLTGLVTDTRAFRTSNVDARAMGVALRLIEAGALLQEITRRSLEQRALSSVRLWGQAIAGLHLQDGVLWTEVTRAMRQRWNLGENSDSGLANFLSGVREAQVVVVFTERDNGLVDVGMRAVPEYDVSQVALHLGGGGHPQAAGCTVEGGLEQVKDQVLAQVWRSLDEQRMARR